MSLDTRATTVPLPRLRAELSITPYGPAQGGGALYVAASDDTACLVSDRAAGILRALAAEPPDLDALILLLESAATPQAPAIERERVVRFLREDIPPGLRHDTVVPARPTPLQIRHRLLGPNATACAGRALAILYSRRIASVLVPLVAVITLLGITQSFSPAVRQSPHSALGVIGLLLLSALAHELGHVTATSAFGARPGEIGIGVYFVFPVFYADVTRSWQLPRGQRLAVSAGGFYFQAILMTLATIVAWTTGAAVARWFVFINALSIMHMLNPAFKMDGYWLLSDAVRIPNLHQRVGATLREFVRALRSAVRGTHPIGDPEQLAATLSGRQKGIIAIYAIFALLYFSIIGRQLWLATVTIAGAPAAFVQSLSYVATRVATAPSLLTQLSRLAELLYLLARPVLLSAGWMFLTMQATRLIVGGRGAQVRVRT